MNLQQVAPGKYLHLPPQHFPLLRDKVWLEPGGVVDADDEFVAEMLTGQEYKLVPAPKGAVASELHIKLTRLREDRERQAAKQPKPKDKLVAKAEAEVEGDIPRPDERPKKKDKVPA